MTDDPLDNLLFDDNDVLERVDEYSLYCHYLEYEPLIGGKYRSPIRPDDDDPSFGIFERKYGYGANEYLWKDQSLGIHGDIFDLISRLYKDCGRHRARQQVCADFGLGGLTITRDKIIKHEAQYTAEIDIKIISRAMNFKEINYWKQYNVNDLLLKQYNVTAIQAYWLTKQEPGIKLYPSYPKGLGFAYRIWDKYQLYFPKQEKKKKFRNNWTDLCVPGFNQLRFDSPRLIVTKSYKDVLCLRSLGYEAISPRGENIMLPQACIDFVQRKYTDICTLFDNDGKHKAAEYPFRELHVPIETGYKDPTDYCAAHGPQRTAELLSVILNS